MMGDICVAFEACTLSLGKMPASPAAPRADNLPPALAALTGRPTCRVEAVQPGDVCFLFAEYFRPSVWEDHQDYHPKIAAAAQRGAAAVVWDEETAHPPPPDQRAAFGVPLLAVPDARAAFGAYAHRFFGLPARDMPVVGVTGTNGKTSVVQLLRQLQTGGPPPARAKPRPAASIGTLGVFHGDQQSAEAAYTTPLAHDLAATLADLRDRGTARVGLEVSSHALALDRVAGLDLAAGIVTNVTRDHLDFHGTPAAYAAAKKRLLEVLPAGAPVILNADDPGARALAPAARGPVWWYGINAPAADVRAVNVKISAHGSRFSLQLAQSPSPPSPEVSTQLVGRFQISNILAAVTALHALGGDWAALCASVARVTPVPGRMETVALPNGATGLVDYAHNPDGLHNLLANCRELPHRRLLLVFGAGGDRDRGKRPEMAAIAAAGADAVILTSDNPRTEDPAQIFADLRAGFPEGVAYPVIADRAAAIRAGYNAAAAGDLLVVAGKGHERTQTIGTTAHPFSDLAQLRALL